MSYKYSAHILVWNPSPSSHWDFAFSSSLLHNGAADGELDLSLSSFVMLTFAPRCSR
ncbi:hypothetical protein M413DRAFT_447275 [Hebeloma cylindrosporum]|uniref:Uncharacterized protein n=1 Tax=Hebeloma cylindrosporum TaxID=76867 RepID=A0A0C3C4Z5_HEBCY|nr:hypothetical protein M413DRAFT_447275 [Hebeloma cylindrosporum h7]